MNRGTCVFCGDDADRDTDHPTTGGTVGVCEPCSTVLARWVAGLPPGTYALGPADERTGCDVCGLPIADKASDLRRDVTGPGDDRPAHAECVTRGEPPAPREHPVSELQVGPHG